MLDPVRYERSRGFGNQELRRIEAIVIEHAAGIREEWDAYFAD
jgi:hypothetical protein